VIKISTRCQIDFISKWKNKEGKEFEERRRVYRHSDGYPDGVIPDLKEFLKWNFSRNEDLEYITANFIYWSKRNFEDTFLKPKWNDGKTIIWNSKEVIEDNNSVIKLGFGICDINKFHGDIEWFYEVINNMGKIEIKIYKCHGWDVKSKEEMSLIKTIKVPLEKKSISAVISQPSI